MSNGRYNEGSFENAVVDILRKSGWDYLYGPDIERDGGDYRCPVLVDCLKAQISRINTGVPQEALDCAFHKVMEIEGGSLVARNMLFTNYLQSGIEAQCSLDGEERTFIVKLVDYENVSRNIFQAVNQWTVVGRYERRADVVLFVNGLPLVLIELKNPSKPNTTVHDAYLQIRNYLQDITELFVYNQICVISDMVSTKAGTITSSENWFKEWKSVDGEREESSVGYFETLFMGLLVPERLLEVVRYFICFDGEDFNSAKILAGYHQYFAVKKAVATTCKAMAGDGRGGVFWHTQGSGKSLSMVFFARLMADTVRGLTFLVLTDRNDLDGQLYGQFLRCKKFLRQTAVQAKSRKLLSEFLSNQKQNGIFFSTIQKFEEASDALSLRRDVVVIADEAHRSHYGFVEKPVSK